MPSDTTSAAGDDGLPAGSVARAIASYQHGNGADLGQLINACFAPLLKKAVAKLRGFPRFDREGLVLSAFGSFLDRAKAGRFPHLNHRVELECLLRLMVRRKIAHAIRDQNAEVAGGGRVQNEPESGLDPSGGGPDPSGEAACKEWLEHMEKKGLRTEAELVQQRCDYHEMAKRMGITESKARRLITLVRAETREFFHLQQHE
jgi:hypothetical protein